MRAFQCLSVGIPLLALAFLLFQHLYDFLVAPFLSHMLGRLTIDICDIWISTSREEHGHKVDIAPVTRNLRGGAGAH